MTQPSIKAKVLVVDDQPVNVQVLAEALSGEYDVRVAGSGERALEIAQKMPQPDLILLDVMMPDMDGFEVYDKLSHDPRTCDIPVIFVTARNDIENETRALAAGARDFISKPINPQVILARVHTHITLRQRELDYQNLNRMLDLRVKERTEQLEERSRQVEALNSALQERASQAEAANEAKIIFLGKMSHELLTPMTAIIGFSDLLKFLVTEAKPNKMVLNIHKAATQLLSTINDILNFTQIESGKLQVVRNDFDLEELFYRFNENMQERAATKKLTFFCFIDPGIPVKLCGDPVKLEQLLFNLASNAIKFTHEGSISVMAHLIQANQSDVELRFEVSDTGIGINASVVERIFTMFEQGDNTLTRPYGGVGLGLSINRKLVELMGGTIGVETELDKGSTFWFTLKFKRSRPLSNMPISRTLQETLQLMRYQPKVLLVDDDFFNLEMFSLMLERTGLSFDQANNGLEAVNMIKTQAYDLVLMDIQMPIMDGLTATQAIRNIPERQQTPIIAISANALEDDVERCLSAGMNAFLAKPIVPEILYEEIAKWIVPR